MSIDRSLQQDIATVGRIAFIADPQRAALGLLTPA